MVGVVGATHKVHVVRELGCDAVIDKSEEDLWARAAMLARLPPRPPKVMWVSSLAFALACRCTTFAWVITVSTPEVDSAHPLRARDRRE